MRVMNLEQRIEKLKQEVELMKECYQKGFGNAIYAVFLNCDLYFNYPEEPDRENFKSIALRCISLAEKKYETIPFENLNLNDFAPLLVVRDLLKEYSEKVKSFFENPEKDTLHGIQSFSGAIVEVGRIYESMFKEKIRELRSMPGQEEYPVVLIDHRGRKYCK